MMQVVRRLSPVLRAVLLLGLCASGVFIVLSPKEQVTLRLNAPQEEASRLPFYGLVTISQTVHVVPRYLERLDVPLETTGRPEAYPLIVHIKRSPEAQEDLRTLYVTQREVQKTGNVLSFRFAPPLRSKEAVDLTLTFDAPNAERGEFVLYKEPDASIYEEGKLSMRGRQIPGNIGLALYHRVPTYRLWFEELRSSIAEEWPTPLPSPSSLREPHRLVFPDFSTPLLERSPTSTAMLLSIVLAVVFMLCTRSSFRRWLLESSPTITRTEWGIVGSLMLASILLHIPYILTYPAVNDEGAYYMDIANIRAGAWPFRDFLTKGPFFLILLSPVILLFPPSLVLPRVVVSLAVAVEVFLLFLLARRLWGKTAGIFSAGLYALLPTVIAQTTQTFLQPFELLFVTSAFLILLPGPKMFPPLHGVRKWTKKMIVDSVWNGLWRTGEFFRRIPRPAVAGGMLAIAYLTRSSALAFLPALMFFGMTPLSGSLPRRIGRGLSVAGGFVVILGLTALLLWPILGTQKLMILFNLEAFAVGQGRVASGQSMSLLEAARAPITEQISALVESGTMVVRSGYPLLLLWLATLALAVARLFRLPSLFALPLLALPLLIGRPTLLDILSQKFAETPLFITWILLGSAFLLSFLVGWSFLRPRQGWVAPLRDLVFLGGTWLALVVLYASLGRFRQHYHAEFLPLYILGSAAFLHWLLFTPEKSASLSRANVSTRASSLQAAVILGLLGTWVGLSHAVTFPNPHVGTIPMTSARDAARSVQLLTESGTEVFTGQPLIAYLAERPLSFAASHPGWYLEERLRTIPSELRQVYFPDLATVRTHIEERNLPVIVVEQRTKEIYLDGDPELRSLLETAYERRVSFEVPGQRSIEIWQKKP